MPGSGGTIDVSDEAGLLAAFDEALDVICGIAGRRLAGPGAWHERVQRAIEGTLQHFAAHPELRWLFFEEVAGASHAVLVERRVAARERYARVFADAFTAHHRCGDVPPLGFEFLVGAGYRAIRTEMLTATGTGTSSAGTGVRHATERARELTRLFAHQPT